MTSPDRDLRRYVDDRIAEGVFRVHPEQRAIGLGADVTDLDPREAALVDAANRIQTAWPGALWKQKVRGGPS